MIYQAIISRSNNSWMGLFFCCRKMMMACVFDASDGLCAHRKESYPSSWIVMKNEEAKGNQLGLSRSATNWISEVWKRFRDCGTGAQGFRGSGVSLSIFEKSLTCIEDPRPDAEGNKKHWMTCLNLYLREFLQVFKNHLETSSTSISTPFQY